MDVQAAQFPADCARKFRAERLLGSGGYGQVWLATQIELDRRVVVKLLHAETAAQPEAVQRFLAEAQVTALLRHPRIVLVLDHGCDEGLPWIAYEFIEGRSLRARLDAGGMPWREACRMGMQVAAALEAAHERGILHRDIKPDNVLESAPGEWKVADFGIAKWSGSAVKTEAGMVLGTPAYLSPQQLRGLVPAFESDVYALGVLLYEAVAGKLPWWDENLALLLHQRLTIAAPPPSAAQAGVPAELDRVILKLISPQREDRIATAAEVRSALERILGERPSQRTRALARPVAAPPPSARSPALLAAVGALALAVVGGGAWMATRPVARPTPSPTATVAAPADPAAARRAIQRSYLALRAGFRPVLLKKVSALGPEQHAAFVDSAIGCLEHFRTLLRSKDTSVAWLDLVWLLDQTIDDGMEVHPKRFEVANAALRNIAREAGAIPAGVFPGVFRAIAVPRIETMLAFQGERNTERILPLYEAAHATVETATGAEWQGSIAGLAHRIYLANEVLFYTRRREAHILSLDTRSQSIVSRIEKLLPLVEGVRAAVVARPALLVEDPDAPLALAQAVHALQGVIDTSAVNRPADTLDRAQAMIALPVPAGVPREAADEIAANKDRLQERVNKRRR